MMKRSMTNPDLIPFGEATLAPTLLPGKQMAAAVPSAAMGIRMGVVVATDPPQATRNCNRRSANVPLKSLIQAPVVKSSLLKGA